MIDILLSLGFVIVDIYNDSFPTLQIMKSQKTIL